MKKKSRKKQTPRKLRYTPKSLGINPRSQKEIDTQAGFTAFLSQVNNPTAAPAEGALPEKPVNPEPPLIAEKRGPGRPRLPPEMLKENRDRLAREAARQEKIRLFQEEGKILPAPKIKDPETAPIEGASGRHKVPEEEKLPKPNRSAALKKVPRTKLLFDPARKAVRNALPHLYGWKWYAWAKAFFDSTNKMNLLVAGNQLSKSSTQIRKCIDWATDQSKWPKLWPNRRPRIFWYLYPSNAVIKTEFEKKWLPEFLPRSGFEHDERFGYEVERTNSEIKAIHFYSGVSVYFKTYAQGTDNLQTSSVDAVYADEEVPADKYDEIKARLFATGGYYHMVFTATLNQDLWRRALEGEGDQELFPNAFKLQVSMYDCLFYADGTASTWTIERIQEIEQDCKSQVEIDRRVRGRFVTESGRKFGSFDPLRHFVKPFPIPDTWDMYAGVDIGGGGDGHPAAICFIAVRPDKQIGYVSLGWRGDGVLTTAGDILEKYQMIRPRRFITRQVYDWQAKDFKTLAGRVADTVGCFEQANKGHDAGEQTVNTLFHGGMLFIFDTPELRKLGAELSSLMKKTLKANAKDDFADAFRYAAMSVPWDFTAISKDFQNEEFEEKTRKEDEPWTSERALLEQIKERRGERPQKGGGGGWAEHDEEIEEWNDAYGS